MPKSPTQGPLHVPLRPLDITCDHNGGIEYWCKECAHLAAPLLRQRIEDLEEENKTLSVHVTALRKANETFARKAGKK
jgi:hypothetical protein